MLLSLFAEAFFLVKIELKVFLEISFCIVLRHHFKIIKNHVH